MAIKKLLVASLILGSSVAQSAEQFVVEDIRFEGLQRVTLGAALLAMPVRVGDGVDERDISEVIQSLFASGNFEDIQVFRDGDTLLVKVLERPTIASITFSGNKAIKEEQLKENLDASRISVGEALDRTTLSKIEKGLEDFYYSVGKYNATVKAVVTPLPRNRADLKFVFTEGVSAKIQQINFIGNTVFTDEELQDKFNLQAEVPWWNFLADEKYQKQVLAGDLEILRSQYLNNGYLKYKLESTQVAISPDKKGVYITLKIHEGEQYRVEDVSFRGNLMDKGDELESLVTIKAGEVYNGAKVTALEEAVKRKLGELGYAYPQVSTIPNFDDDSQQVSLIVNVDPGKRIYVRNIGFSGNVSTKDEVLRREMRQMEGSWLNSKSVERGKERLNRTGFFETVDVQTVRVPGTDDQVDLQYTVKEANAGNINFGIGYGTESGISFQAGIQQDNFLGTGNRFGISAMMNDYQKNISMEYRDPYFTLDGVSLGGKVYYNEFEASDANISDYTNQSYGTSLTWGFPYDELNFFEFGLGYDHNKISNTQEYYQIEKFKAIHGFDRGDSVIELDDFDWSVSWTRNNLNRGYFPTAGNHQRASFRMTVPGSDAQYFKAQYNVRQYYPLDEDHHFSLLLRGKLGYGNGYGTTDNGSDHLLPFYENFYAGGFSTLRGFRSNTVGPKAVYVSGCPTGGIGGGGNNSCATGTDDAAGGNAVALASVELIVPTPFASEEAQNQLRTSVFVDAGTVWDTEYDLTDDDGRFLNDYSDPSLIRASYGAALQWMSPMGPLVFSIARPIKKYEGDDEEFFTFTIGRTF
ncbi:outer membrane protein assembly factor BamA [Photobacterium atrarenae]|uniref:Outer membrane protein assembly factor BamA n=1 Tax=Photobacterium atrarenae TaxID=865757 RepID=A0ABY5GH70_9GAMM|nr:outer membrane protein assembly factor BamA [Photobacterium atrarenae]UTV28278.1 outer membrane protein assembly factor BamA [Photobacterium atrarenae]